MSFYQYFSLINVQARMLLKADASKFKLGFMWWFLEPLMWVGVFYIVFSLILDTGRKSGDFIYFLAYRYGITRFRENLINSRYSDIRIGRWFDIILKYVIPVELVVMSGWFLIQTVRSPIEEWWMGGPIGLALLLLQWGLAVAGLWYISSRVKDKLVDDTLSMDTTIDQDIDLYESEEMVPQEGG